MSMSLVCLCSHLHNISKEPIAFKKKNFLPEHLIVLKRSTKEKYRKFLN